MKLSQLPPTVPDARKPRFASAMHAVVWYFATKDRYTVAKSPHDVLFARLATGTVVQGGVGSVLESQLCLLADVELCLPLPQTPMRKPLNEEWLRWTVFAVGVQNELPLADIARNVARGCDVTLSTTEARKLLSDAIWHVTTRLRERGLVS